MALQDRAWKNYSTIALFLATLVCAAAAAWMLIAARTDAALRSPWEVVSPRFFVLMGLAIAGMIRLPVAASIIVTTLAYSVALIVYKLGFGFDPFIHEATAELIRAQGFITPAPFYGWGLYLPVVMLSHIPGLTVAAVTKAFLPILAGITVPLIIWWYTKNAKMAALTLALPFSLFIMTTPQGLADLILFVLAFVVATNSFDRRIAWLLAVATLVTHPIAGIPAIFLALFSSLRGVLRRSQPKADPPLADNLILWLLAALALPVALALYKGFDVQLGFFPSLDIFRSLFPIIPNRFDPLFDLADFYKSIVPILVVGLALHGVRRSDGKFTPHLLIASALAVSYVVVRSFFRLGTIEYESTIIPLRLLEVAGILLIPAATTAVQNALPNIRGPALSVGALLLVVGVSTASIYTSFPRVDRYEKSPGVSVSAATFEAVHEIEKNFPAPYIVLANQTAAAAVISEYGFRRYYGDDFYYAHPSGGLRLYRYFLAMTDGTPTRELAKAAAREAGVPTVYLVMHHYWKKFDATVSAAKLSADSWQSIADGKIYIFKYDFTAKTTP